jgi:hypothetical protein
LNANFAQHASPDEPELGTTQSQLVIVNMCTIHIPRTSQNKMQSRGHKFKFIIHISTVNLSWLKNEEKFVYGSNLFG